VVALWLSEAVASQHCWLLQAGAAERCWLVCYPTAAPATLVPAHLPGLPWQPARSKPQAQSQCSACTHPRPALCTSHCSEARTAAVASSEAAAARCSAARRAARSWHSAVCAASSVVHCGSPGCIAKPRTPQVPWPARYGTQHRLAGALRYQAVKGQHRCARPEHKLDRKQAWPCCC